ncbi:MAG: hypothetical protein EAY65_04215 [Alphaproteobacteria bacterium]|nr:MAG: hypothetical protein EAY65_04215 [Alphaproteobacteria bacterium]
MKTRSQALNDLLEYNQPIDWITTALKKFPWDSDTIYAVLTRTHIITVLQRYLDATLCEHRVETWANAVEGRDDIAWEQGYEELLQETIHQLANPLLTLSLTQNAAKKIMNVLMSDARM